MTIQNYIDKHILELNQELKIDLNNKITKPVIFIDNFNYSSDKALVGIAYLNTFAEEEIVNFDEDMRVDNIFSLVNLIDDSFILCLWGQDNIDEIKADLNSKGICISENTIIVDLKQESSKFFDTNMTEIEDATSVISFSNMPIVNSFDTKETIMYALYIEMINNGYMNDNLLESVDISINKIHHAYMSNSYKGASFRETKGDIIIEKSELEYMSKFAQDMSLYLKVCSEEIERILMNENISDTARLLLEEKLTVMKVKKGIYTYIKVMCEEFKNQDMSEYIFYLRTIELYLMMEDAYRYSSELSMLDSYDSYSNFVSQLGATFSMSGSPNAYAYILRKNVLSLLSK